MSAFAKRRTPSKVFLWTIPRGGSTVFYRSITSNGNIKGYFEPYVTAEHHGFEGCMTRSHAEEELLLEPQYTFEAVKRWLEAEKSSDVDVFVKDFPYAVQDRFHLLPEGSFKHSFLIRKPESVYKSYYRVIKRKGGNGEALFKNWLPDTNRLFKSLCDLAEYLETRLKEDIVIIDIDDVMARPAEMIQKYCASVGFSYDESFLHWTKGVPLNCPRTIVEMESTYGWLGNAINSTGWGEGLRKTVGQDEFEEYPEIVWNKIEAAEPYYQKLRNHDRCLRLEN